MAQIGVLELLQLQRWQTIFQHPQSTMLAVRRKAAMFRFHGGW
jgi:uncharacterized protein YqiB (DUF1249 family)